MVVGLICGPEVMRMATRVRKAAPKPAKSAARKVPEIVNGVAKAEPISEMVRMRAYYIFLARGGSHGNDLADWLAAEREVRSASAG